MDVSVTVRAIINATGRPLRQAEDLAALLTDEERAKVADIVEQSGGRQGIEQLLASAMERQPPRVIDLFNVAE